MTVRDELYLGKTSYQVLGNRPVRHDGADKVTGKAIYAADIQLPGMVHGKIVRSPHAHARIKSIDAEEALKIPGVFAVVTAADFPKLESRSEVMGEGGAVNSEHMAANCLARDKVLYKGHPVAAVAAANAYLAEEAATKIQVEYEPLPSVTWVLDAMRDGAPSCTTTCAPTFWARRVTSRRTLRFIFSSKKETSPRVSGRRMSWWSANSGLPASTRDTSSRTRRWLSGTRTIA